MADVDSKLYTVDKQALLRALARRRQAARWPGYGCIGDYRQGRYECDAVSPYTKTAKNTDASIFLLLQDWASDDRLRQPFDQDLAERGHDRELRTNITLVRLLRQAFSVGLDDIYGTNLFPFIKCGPMSNSIAFPDLLRAAREYAIPQIDIVKPRLVICLGLVTFRAIASALGQPVPARLQDAMATPFVYSGAEVWCRPHPASRGWAFDNWTVRSRYGPKAGHEHQRATELCKAGAGDH
jgi:uracil-DNA glycosylase